jgi:hypothetical protein
MQNPTISITESKSKHKYINYVKTAFDKCLNDESKLPSWILTLDGMSGKRYRHFINNLTSMVPKCRYLEIGSWKGSTLCSALYGNDIKSYAIDNWSQFNGPKEEFESNVKRCIDESTELSTIDFEFNEIDYNNIDYSKIGKYNIYLYDGPHEYQDQYNALKYGLDCLENEFIFICDDWNWPFPREATEKSINDLNIEVLYSIEILTSLEDCARGVYFQNSDWHNGYFISVCRKGSKNKEEVEI